MRNLFDQYQQPENRLTHALVSTLRNESSLARPFLRWAGVARPPHLSELSVVEQQVPGRRESGEEDERRGLPDACFFTEDGWALVLEAKINAKPTRNQIERHRNTAARHGYEAAAALLLCVRAPLWEFPSWCTCRTWAELYEWLGKARRADSSWVAALREYMQLLESRLPAQGYEIPEPGVLTMFDGIHFDDDQPYNYLRAKSLVRSLGDELRKVPRLRQVGLDPKGKGRSAITGSGSDRVWDFIPIRMARSSGAHTSFPHFTLALHGDHLEAAITVPNGVKVKGGLRSKLLELGENGFCDLLVDIEKQAQKRLRGVEGAKTVLYAVQRHFRSQRSQGVEDGRIEADLRTARGDHSGEVKYQPEWVEAIYHLLTSKRSGVNVQFGVTTKIPYANRVVRSARLIDLVADLWVAQSPLIDFVLSPG